MDVSFLYRGVSFSIFDFLAGVKVVLEIIHSGIDIIIIPLGARYREMAPFLKPSFEITVITLRVNEIYIPICCLRSSQFAATP